MATDLKRLLGLTTLVVGTALLGGCSSDSPSEPNQAPGQPPGSGGGTTTSFVITVTPNPRELVREEGGEALTSQITIQVRRASDGAVPATGTTATVSVDFGVFATGAGDVQSTTVSLVGGSATLIYVAPDSGQGTARITAQLQSSIGQGTISIRDAELVPFFLTNVSPASGADDGGYLVSVNGGGFKSPVQVLVDGVSAEIISVSDSQIQIRVPAARTPVPVGQTRAVTVAVTSEIGLPSQQSASLAQGFVYIGDGVVNVPVIASLTPTSAPRDGGTPITIRGSGFESPVQVLFAAGSNQVEAPIQSVSAGQIVVLTPAARQLGNPPSSTAIVVTVRNLSTGLSATIDQFRYTTTIFVTALSPNEGHYAGGLDVTVFGEGFEAPVQVLFGGVEQTVLSVSGREILVRTRGIQPTTCGLISVASQVTNLGNGESAPGPSFGFFVPTPLITGISPTSVLGAAGGQQATISGGNFEAPVRVMFGDQSASVVSSTSTSIVVIVPALAGGFETEACDDNGDGTEGERFIPTAVDITVTNLVTGCEDVFEGGFLYRPTDTSCRGDVAPDGDGGGGPSGDP